LYGFFLNLFVANFHPFLLASVAIWGHRIQSFDQQVMNELKFETMFTLDN